MIFGKEATKNPAEQHGSDQASKYNESGESGIHYELLVTWFRLSLSQLLQICEERVTK